MTTYTLTPAKPYVGKSQHVAVSAAITRLTKAGLPLSRSDDRWGMGLSTSVRKYRKTVENGGSRIHLDVALLTMTVRTYQGSGMAMGATKVDEQRVARLDAVAALRAAGWYLERVKLYAANVDTEEYLVYGHGIVDWLEVCAQNDRLYRERRAEFMAKEEAVNDELRALLRDHGLDHAVQRVSNGRVELSLADMLAFERSCQEMAGPR